MNEIQIFKNEDFGTIRTIEENGKIIFCGNDVATSLGYTNPQKALKDHCREDGVTFRSVIDSVGRTQQAKFIDEGNLYRLITHSKLPSAERFEKWVFDEVLPTIRKHGAYMTEQTIEQALTNPDFLIRLATNLKEEQAKRKELEAKIEEQKPKVEFAEHVAAANNTMLVREVAKLASKEGIKIGEKRLYEKLRAWGLIFKNSCEATQKAIEQGLFEVTEGVRESSKGKFIYKTTRVTGKGQIYIINRLKKELPQHCEELEEWENECHETSKNK